MHKNIKFHIKHNVSSIRSEWTEQRLPSFYSMLQVGSICSNIAQICPNQLNKVLSNTGNYHNTADAKETF